jgi:hypothetical protein
MFHVNTLRPYATAMLWPFVHVTTPRDDDEYAVDQIFVVEIDNVLWRRGKYMLLYTHFKDEQIPRVWHRLN